MELDQCRQNQEEEWPEEEEEKEEGDGYLNTMREKEREIGPTSSQDCATTVGNTGTRLVNAESRMQMWRKERARMEVRAREVMETTAREDIKEDIKEERDIKDQRDKEMHGRDLERDLECIGLTLHRPLSHPCRTHSTTMDGEESPYGH